MPCAYQAHLQAYAVPSFRQKAFEHQTISSYEQTSCQGRLRDTQSRQSISSILDSAALLGFGIGEGPTCKVWSRQVSYEALILP